MKIFIEVNVLDEAQLRKLASVRMAQSGYERDPAVHENDPLAELAFQALIGSNADPLCPVDLGLEIVKWGDLEKTSCAPAPARCQK